MCPLSVAVITNNAMLAHFTATRRVAALLRSRSAFRICQVCQIDSFTMLDAPFCREKRGVLRGVCGGTLMSGQLKHGTLPNGSAMG
jgi:hypothetical protein